MTMPEETPSTTSPSDAALIREQFLSCYSKKYGRPYAGWGARENSQATNWVKSCPIQKALALCRFYPEWPDYLATKSGHAFGLLVMRWIEVDAWLQDGQAHLYRVAEARALEKLTLTVGDSVNVRAFAEQSRRAEQVSVFHSHQIQDQAQRGISGPCGGVLGSDDEAQGFDEDA